MTSRKTVLKKDDAAKALAKKANNKKKPVKSVAKKEDSQSEDSKSELRLEVWGLLFLALALILIISLFTYSTGNDSKANWIGEIGQSISYYSLQSFGYSAYLLAIALGAIGIILSMRRSVAIKIKGAAGFFIGSLVCSIMFDLFLPDKGMAYKPGGVAGNLINKLAIPALGEVGVSIIGFLLLILAIVMATNLPPMRTAMVIGLTIYDLFANFVSKIASLISSVFISIKNSYKDYKKNRQLKSQKEFEELSNIPDETHKISETKKTAPVISQMDLPAINQSDENNEEDENQAKPSILDRGEKDIVIERTKLVPETVISKEPEVLKDNNSQTETVRQTERIPDTPQNASATENITTKNGEPQIVDSRPKPPSSKEIENTKFVTEELEEYMLPPISLLKFNGDEISDIDRESLLAKANLLEQTLLDYKIEGKVQEIHPGPVITMYEFAPARGTKLSRISNLEDDLAMALAALKVRIVAPIPGKSVVGIEVPSANRETVYLKEIIGHKKFSKARSKLTVALGKDIFGHPVVADLQKMPHLLIAGATGAGKSVGVNAMILSILFRNTPEQVRFILIDPKRLEFNFYEGIPHLLLPVVTDPKQASLALGWVVHEMDKRYKELSEWGVKNIDSFNRLVKKINLAKEESGGDIDQLIEEFADSEGGNIRSIAKKLKNSPMPESMPYIVVVIDELADLMMVAGKEVEISIARLAQLARASGIHLIVATQRPSTDVLTGLIKNNFPARISFRVAQKVDSRVILDTNGAESLLGMGDMLFMSPGKVSERVHGAYVSEKETNQIVDFIRQQRRATYKNDILEKIEEQADVAKTEAEDYDSEYDNAVAIVCDSNKASISLLQRKLRIGYNRAARIIEKMEEDGLVGPSEGVKGRAVYASRIK